MATNLEKLVVEPSLRSEHYNALLAEARKVAAELARLRIENDALTKRLIFEEEEHNKEYDALKAENERLAKLVGTSMGDIEALKHNSFLEREALASMIEREKEWRKAAEAEVERLREALKSMVHRFAHRAFYPGEHEAVKEADAALAHGAQSQEGA